MAGVIFWAVIFVLALVILVKASDTFTDSAEEIGLYLGLPAFIVGVTIVALGTSLPELVSSLIAVFKGQTEIVAGNAVGSNIANIFLVLGVSAIVAKKLKTSYELIRVDLPLLMGSAFLLALFCWDGKFAWQEGVISLLGLLVYLHFTVYSEKKTDDKEIKKEMKAQLSKKHPFSTKPWVIAVISAVAIFFGAQYTIEAIIELSKMLGIGADVIAASAVALGTSLPELVVSISAARRGKPEIAIGNVLGSNIFNSFAVMGIPALFATLVISESVLTFALPVMIIASLLYFFIAQDKEITKWEGALLVLFYITFMGKLFVLF